MISFEEWAKEIVLVIDTREKNIAHIIRALKKYGVSYVVEKLDFGDYAYKMGSVLFPEVIERKASLTEICGNLTKQRERFKREFERVPDDVKMFMVIEDSLDNVFLGNYRSSMSPQSLIASLLTFDNRYCLNTYYVSKINSGELILKLFYYCYRNALIENEL